MSRMGPPIRLIFRKDDYDDNIDLIKQMFKDEEDN